MHRAAAPLGSKDQIQQRSNAVMQKVTKQPLFDLGQLVATPGALAALEKTGQNAMEFLSRHVTGDSQGRQGREPTQP
jgi:hypothetical protein